MKKSILNVSLNAGCTTLPAAQQHWTRQYAFMFSTIFCEFVLALLDNKPFKNGLQRRFAESKSSLLLTLMTETPRDRV